MNIGNLKFNFMETNIYLDETLFRRNEYVRINKNKLFMLMNTFPVSKMDSELNKII